MVSASEGRRTLPKKKGGGGARKKTTKQNPKSSRVLFTTDQTFLRHVGSRGAKPARGLAGPPERRRGSLRAARQRGRAGKRPTARGEGWAGAAASCRSPQDSSAGVSVLDGGVRVLHGGARWVLAAAPL